VGKLKFELLAKDGALKDVYLPPASSTTDLAVASNAVRIILQTKPNLMFVHFPGADGAGHGKQWGSAEQLKVVGDIDICIGQILAAYKELRWTDSMFILLSADHGGSGQSHGANDDRSKYIPWILVGPGVRQGYDLTRQKNLDIRTEDTFSTACRILGIAVDHKVEGRPVEEVFMPTELLQSK
jgi:predicted AlkP superfamily pyrophosphatase or phosphodiesterase